MDLIVFWENNMNKKEKSCVGFTADVKSFTDFSAILEEFNVENIFSDEDSIIIKNLNNISHPLKKLKGAKWKYLKYGRTGIITEVCQEELKLFQKKYNQN